MSEELIRKSEVLELLDKVKCHDYDSILADVWNSSINKAISIIEKMPPVNAVELPCKVGDIIYEPCKTCKDIHTYEVKGFKFYENIELIDCKNREFFFYQLGKEVFLTREEAERALEGLKNE